jgi:hypothetical protein
MKCMVQEASKKSSVSIARRDLIPALTLKKHSNSGWRCELDR